MRLHKYIDALSADLAHVRKLLSAAEGNAENAGEHAAAARMTAVESVEGVSPEVSWRRATHAYVYIYTYIHMHA